jgi:hypothetical protein
MATKRKRKNDAAAELRKLRRSNSEYRRALKKARKDLLLCVEKCIKKLNDPPWHYGPRCNHP